MGPLSINNSLPHGDPRDNDLNYDKDDCSMEEYELLKVPRLCTYFTTDCQVQKQKYKFIHFV